MATGIGGKISLDGAASFKQAMKLAAQQAKNLRTEMASVMSQFGATEKSEKSLTAQNKVLADSLNVQRNTAAKVSSELGIQTAKLKALEQEVARTTKEYGENSKEAQRATKEYASQAIEVNNLEARYNQAQTEINKMTRQIDENNQAIRDVQRGYNDAGQKLDEFGRVADDAGGKTRTLADIIKGNLLAKAIFEGLRKLVSLVKDFAVGIVETAATVQAENAQFEQTFGDMQSAASDAMGRVAKDAGILQSRLQVAGSGIYAFAKASGADSTLALELMERSLVVAADSAAYYDRSLEDTTESLRSFLKGNYANDAALGVSATETTRNAKANELFAQSFKDLSEAQKQVTLLAMVEDANRLSGALGQAARESDGYENVMGNLKETWRQFQAIVGKPFLENLIPIVQELTASFQEWMNDVDWDAFSDTITGAVKFLMDNGGTILGIVAGIAAAFVGWNVGSVITQVIASLKALIPALSGATAATKGLNTAMAANPIGLVIAVIATLVTALITLWNTNEDFRNAVIAAWEAIKTTVGSIGEFIVHFFTVTLPDALNAAAAWFSELPGKVWQWLDETVKKVIAWGANLVREAKEGALNMVNTVVDAVTSLPGKMVEVGKNIVSGIWEGIQGAGQWLWDKVSGFGDWIVGGFKGIFGIASPAKRLRDEIGKMLPPGIAIGFEQALPRAVNDMNHALDGMTHSMANSLSNIQDATYASYNALPAASPAQSNVSIQVNVDVTGSRPEDVEDWRTMFSRIAEALSERIDTNTGRKLVAEGA